MTRIAAEWIARAETRRVCTMLTEAGYRALFVGGCVRNALLGAPVSDIDIATDATPEVVMRLAKSAGLRAVPTGIDHGTVTVVSRGLAHEITTFRRDIETDGRRAVVAFTDDVTEDARRRDFTMNALYADPAGEVIDPLGGLPDLQDRRVRFIEDPEARIREDYLRILRFFRFYAWYGDPALGFDAEGLAACARLADGLEGLSKERIGAEMRKLLSAPDPAPAITGMASAGCLARVLPGAEASSMAVLVHLEATVVALPDAMRRLAVLGGTDPAENLRLSKVEARKLTLIRDEIGSLAGAAELGYRHGADLARDVMLARAALLEQTLPVGMQGDIARGAAAIFPVPAADLMDRLKGPALGAALRTLEKDWIASGFSLSRDDLLARFP